MPEKVHLKVVDREKLWKRIWTGSNTNDCMITISTSDIEDEKKIGLASNHAYAVLEVIQEGGLRILLVKNPWGNFRWNGKFSTDDKLNWTETLKQKLHFYDLAARDNGIFWIDFDSMIENFDTMDINWNPALLVYRNSVWDLWDCAHLSGSTSNLLLNPQYAIEFSVNPADPMKEVICWGILTRIAAPEESRWSEDRYIGMSAYESNKLEKITYGANSLNELVLTNNEHYLFKAVLSKERLMCNKYIIIVVKQHQIKDKFPFKYFLFIL
eukprot:TRINITY_DN10270_c0_g1_i8.p1 TRINITY_DN10270_c0_g1~~TRINITY_DN10270_c0_g1_i8.p1  ORF type:complete len:269 (+),score=71.97 TRINITY_DN10270_c0_g1_i8:1356-2162(+)